MSTLPQKRYTVEEYLNLEEGAEYKSQYYDGEIFAMAGASLSHNRIAANVVGILHDKLRGTACEVLPSDLMIKCPTGLYSYADTIVVCGKPEIMKHRDVHVLLNPQVIIEVLSDSTESFDRGKKFAHYRSIPSLAEYLLVAQDRYCIDQFWRDQTNDWRLDAVNGCDGIVEVKSLACSLAMSAVYERVEIPAVEVLPRFKPPFENL
ncbi:MAG: Uma2 family endonuclease [Pirellulales bacterium]